MILTVRRLRQEDCCQFEANLGLKIRKERRRGGGTKGGREGRREGGRGGGEEERKEAREKAVLFAADGAWRICILTRALHISS
jgi:hypothetical protein